MARLWSILVLLAAVTFAASPWFVDGFKGFSADQFPVQVQNPPVQPAGYAFAIWGLIYVWLIAGAVFGAIWRGDDPDWAEMRPPLFASLVVGTVWLPVAVASPLRATLLIWAMLGTALLALFRVGDTDRWWQRAPVAIYAGWLTAASAVAVGVLLGGYGWMAPTPAALVSLALGLGIALVVQYRLHRAPSYGVTVIWALVGVIVANYQPLNIAVAGLAVLGIIAILALRGTDTE
ncbi:hypothetical protein [Puniceibacterium sediminis]|uniref:TspO and MBR related proteins n=1 Tax=Puniceibacterium sediminis TaxID=1608407 RepID=A0A238UZ50_9RHOB|nr:hypothetical protein [Puniceibacterium sediminis]SNR27027.1 hypothetical protein SAMN06265370_101321 [Puniceibacterium sediminis]